MAEVTLGGPAIGVFLQALAVTIRNMEELEPEKRNSDEFIGKLDDYLWMTVAIAEKKMSLSVREDVEFLRNGLKAALDQSGSFVAPTGNGN